MTYLRELQEKVDSVQAEVDAESVLFDRCAITFADYSFTVGCLQKAIEDLQEAEYKLEQAMPVLVSDCCGGTVYKREYDPEYICNDCNELCDAEEEITQ